ncbi:hypothetical protein HNY73_000719 [Argiope bruennichi]|uniref:Uncharacterized protein n=1 Tax=Argiope bruennichi TaxID=94029 RepID=A0A8T0G1F5_ARGBR|nr:hypothetical protein HNY73_000719 [Argiope bruennichi]
MSSDESVNYYSNFLVMKDLENVVSKYRIQCSDALQLNQTLHRACAEMIMKLHHLRKNNDSGDNFHEANDKQKSKTCDAKVSNQKQKSDNPDSSEERLIDQIRKITEENLNLRGSKVKLQRLSKLEDKKIRNLQRRIETDKRKLDQNCIDKHAIQEQKNRIKNKIFEIQKLQREIKETEKQMRIRMESVKKNRNEPKRIFTKKPQNYNLEIQNGTTTSKNPNLLPIILKMKDLLGQIAVEVSDAEQDDE